MLYLYFVCCICIFVYSFSVTYPLKWTNKFTENDQVRHKTILFTPVFGPPLFEEAKVMAHAAD